MNDNELKLLAALQPVIREKMGVLREGDKYLVPNGNIYIWMSNTILMSDVIRIPPAIDTENPERGCEGMIAGLVTIGKALFKKDSHFVTVRRVDAEGKYRDFVSFKGETPYEALLRALASQVGGKG